MPVLHNRVSNEELKARMLAETEPRTTVSFYKYFQLDEPQAFRDALYMALTEMNVFGRVYIAKEGINAQISVPQSLFDAFKTRLYQSHPALNNIRLYIALEDDGKSFWVLRMKVRERIVADGIDDPTFDPSQVGHYLKAEEVNRMAEDPSTVFVDMRNHYEYEVGHFENALIVKRTSSCIAQVVFVVKKPARTCFIMGIKMCSMSKAGSLSMCVRRKLRDFPSSS